MNILYGVQTTGNGHINRSREIIKEMKNRGHYVLTLFSGRDINGRWGIGEEFEPYIFRKGLTFQTENGRMKYIETAINMNFPRFLKDSFDLSKTLNDYDIIISDFEPVTILASRLKNKFTINLSHQSSFYYDSVPKQGGRPLSKFILENFARGDLNIGVHWDQFSKENIIIPPSLPINLTDKTQPNKVLVYLPFENTFECAKVFLNFPDYTFHFYSKESERVLDNIHFRSFSRENFLNDLQEAEFVIANAGFELISESLNIGKKILAKPVYKQVEQESNAIALRKLNLAITTTEITNKALNNFFDNSIRVKKDYVDSPKLFVDWIEMKDYSNTKTLMKSMWG